MIRQMRSAEKMRVVQPKVKALQEKYKDDRQKQSEEMMKLWKEEGINPLGGCLPLVFQFPVLIGLFFALQSSIGLRHAPFVLWINDLSQPATLFTSPGAEWSQTEMARRCPSRVNPCHTPGNAVLGGPYGHRVRFSTGRIAASRKEVRPLPEVQHTSGNGV